jgi:hypothetical protein
MLTRSKTAALLFGDKQRTKSRPQNLVLLERQNFFERDGLHCLIPEREPGGSFSTIRSFINQMIIIIIQRRALRSRIEPAVGFGTNAVQDASIRLAS